MFNRLRQLRAPVRRSTRIVWVVAGSFVGPALMSIAAAEEAKRVPQQCAECEQVIKRAKEASDATCDTLGGDVATACHVDALGVFLEASNASAAYMNLRAKLTYDEFSRELGLAPPDPAADKKFDQAVAAMRAQAAAFEQKYHIPMSD